MAQIELWVWILNGGLSFVAVLGNAAVIFIIFTRRKLHVMANWFVLSLAVADFTFAGFNVAALKMHDGSNHSPNTTLVLFNVALVLATASVISLCVMTFDRYIAIVHPLRYVTFMRPTRVGVLIAAPWIIAPLRPLFFTEHISLIRSFDLALFQLIPCVALILATTHILLIVRRHAKQRAALSAQLLHNYPLRSSQKGRGNRRKIRPVASREAISAKVLVTVMAVFVACYGLGTYNVFVPFNQLNTSLLHILIVLNSACNPIAYAFFKTDIKREMRAVLCCFKKNRKISVPRSDGLRSENRAT